MKMDEIVLVLKDCRHGIPKFLCRRCAPRSAPQHVEKRERVHLSPEAVAELHNNSD